MRWILILLIVTSAQLNTTTSASESHKASFSTSNIKPWGYKDDNVYKGLLYQVADALQTESGISITNQLRPYPRVIQELKNGSVDFAIMFNSPQAREIGKSVGRVVNTKILLISLKDTPKISDLNELSQKHIGYMRGSKYGNDFDNNQNIIKVPLNSMRQGIQMLFKNRLQAIAGAEQTFYFNLKELNISTDDVSQIMVINETSGDLYFSKASKNIHLIEPFAKALKKINQEGKLDKIFYNNAYMPKQRVKTSSPNLALELKSQKN